MSNSSGKPVDADKLKQFLKRRKEAAATEVAEEVEIIEETNSRETNSRESGSLSQADGFSGLPEFENVAVPPIRRPQALAAARIGTTGGPSAEKIHDLEKLVQQVRLIGLAAIMLLSLLIVIEIAKPLVAAFMPTDYDYLVYNLQDETQSDVKDELEIEGWELVSFGFGSAIYKRSK